MTALGPLGIGLSVVFGCFVLILLAEIYYIVYSGRRNTIDDSSGESGLGAEVEERVHRSERRPLSLLNLFCWKRKPRFRDLPSSGVVDDDHSSSSNVVFVVEDATAMADTGGLQSSPFMGSSELASKLFPFLGDCDILNLAGMLGPPRLLFTIKEETKEDIDFEDTKSKNGRSRRASRASSEFLPPIDSESITSVETPFVTPPSSPFLAALSSSPPFGADKEAPLSPRLLAKSVNMVSADEFSSSFSSSSSETITPPFPSSPPSLRRLSILVEESSSSSSSSSSSATPFTASPQMPSHSTCWNRSLLDVFSEIPPPSSLMLHQNRVYPVEASFEVSASIRRDQFPTERFRQNHKAGSLLPEDSRINSFCCTEGIPPDSPCQPPPSQNANDLPTAISQSWPSSPTSALLSTQSSPNFTSPTSCPSDVSSN